MENKKSENLTKGDIISVIALLLMGVVVFFGMNFKTLGDKVSSIIVALLLVVLMLVFVFFAAHAKAQNRNQSTWRAIEYTMLGLYTLALIPCYLYSSKFVDIQFGKNSIVRQANQDIETIDKMFAEYNKKCESRASSYLTDLQALAKDDLGRKRIASMLEIREDEVTGEVVAQAAETFNNMLKAGEYSGIEYEKNILKENVDKNYNNWNLLYAPLYAIELSAAKEKYSSKLDDIYHKTHNTLESNVPEFDISHYSTTSDLKSAFSGPIGFSIGGLFCVSLLGFLGLVKYILGEKRTVIPFKEGDATIITEDGGFTI